MKNIKVVDKKTFRLWCHEMELTTKQASALLRISRPQIYKYIDEGSDSDVNGTVKVICELINLLDKSERINFIIESLESESCDEPWPAKTPISKFPIQIKR
jgi:predicted transcriptional regulator